ncbi:DUF2332 domain-containing protein [Sphingomonas sp. MG17]|uniref:DUF2332 domain-containing protein n=1 Tax=Sphingomonas tagetis TaxID=2949092 RepID=A0A9X2HKZ3_9SPHN|nr:DUF2332 domain-containing protein [Sphingomonas tagetis]MCP3730521.1 DUF2332 domain-containing protein [Sphingomonas tagetis]
MTDLMALDDPRDAFANQIDYCRANGAPLTARVVEAILANFDGPGAFVAKLRGWPGKPMADALPLRAAGALHALHLSGAEPSLAPLYAGEEAALADAEALIGAAITRHDAALLPWLDGPPQTNEAGRSAAYMAALLWLGAQGLPTRWDCIEIGSSAGINLMMDRYRYDLGGVGAGPPQSDMWIAPEWRGPPPPDAARGKTLATWRFESMRGCDVAPLDLTDPAQLLRLRAYTWPEHRERFARLDFAAYSAAVERPDLVQADAAQFVAAALAQPQAAGTTRVLMHSVVWQYLGAERQAAITAAMAAAAARATSDRPLAWIALEANRATFRHELTVRYWPGDGDANMLAHAHAHGAWVEWLA